MEWEGSRESNWERWERKIVGLVDSPHHACQAVVIARDAILENREIVGNPFFWSEVVLKLPGGPSYQKY